MNPSNLGKSVTPGSVSIAYVPMGFGVLTPQAMHPSMGEDAAALATQFDAVRAQEEQMWAAHEHARRHGGDAPGGMLFFR